MKLAYSTRDVFAASFLEQCDLARDYGFSGFEIFDPVTERASHGDSIFRGNRLSDAKRKLRNRRLTVTALRFPLPLDHPGVTAHQLYSVVEMADQAGVEQVIVALEREMPMEQLQSLLRDAVAHAEETGIEILFETSGPLAGSEHAVQLLRRFASVCLGVSWNVRGTFFDAKESVETTIKTLGAYIRYVRLGDRKDGVNVLLGEGSLPIDPLLRALRSLNFEGTICADWNDEIRHADVVLTHFVSFLNGREGSGREQKLQYNRSRTGTFPWPKYEQVDLTFSQVLDTMAELYPDQYAFKYTTLDYTRTYAQFRDDVDKVAAAFITMGVKPG
ncbi:MAG: TIM barrel protein, partial [Lachnospiraceae bacterium]|nr:TIM barrel protein [Lachnospiraceae bacterium]